jgi:hypothetical protein
MFFLLSVIFSGETYLQYYAEKKYCDSVCTLKSQTCTTVQAQKQRTKGRNCNITK